ncbi:hypothetical protein ACNKHW_01490 [Shigella flexneri]
MRPMVRKLVAEMRENR